MLPFLVCFAFLHSFSILAESHKLPSAVFEIENFEAEDFQSPSDPMKGPFPKLWEEGNLKDGVRDYAVVQENGESFLRAKYLPGTSGTVIHRKIEWDLNEYPIIKWRWRIHAWAKGADSYDDDKEDSPASVYVTIKRGLGADVIKYIWAETSPVGKAYRKGRFNPMGGLRAHVIRSGGKLGEWVEESRNIAEDYKKFFGRDSLPSTKAAGIGVLTDGDATQTQPSADYDDFRALKN